MVTSEIPRGLQHMLDAETSVCRESQSTDLDHPLANLCDHRLNPLGSLGCTPSRALTGWKTRLAVPWRNNPPDRIEANDSHKGKSPPKRKRQLRFEQKREAQAIQFPRHTHGLIFNVAAAQAPSFGLPLCSLTSVSICQG
ncbi:uncharacterized protein BO96DRAFT_438434 [Aspergillus niger CBS 101883]|uniref:Contig An01c0120, genomic contig n=2 Tax=Aspergillus niger TaxID=5061 RepID=A2Q8D5_ASPNC|nr:uncharacterized protein BO96DRAFT_438434 [Aspergillus niger CBS 101883]XP_059599604.1 uncharacterized protein An01g03960 [Aspergillus niger]PYH51929.1 hypothetical protein BO96DRAFT_438434 [Aspergillus niger CBS 101883]CAK36932.1 unnamed protein product [Aspergillus niger]